MQLLRAVCFALAFTTPEGEATGATLAQRERVEFDEDLIRETVKTVADVVDREYFDPEVASQVQASLRERQSRGLFRWRARNHQARLTEQHARRLRQRREDLELDAAHHPQAEQARESVLRFGFRCDRTALFSCSARCGKGEAVTRRRRGVCRRPLCIIKDVL